MKTCLSHQAEIIKRAFLIGLENSRSQGGKLPSNCTKFHPKLCKKYLKSECDFSNFAQNFARCFVMRTHTVEKSQFYSRDFRIRSSFSAQQLNVRAAVSEFRIQYSQGDGKRPPWYSCTYMYYTGNG